MAKIIHVVISCEYIMKLCFMMVLAELEPFILFSVTLAFFEGVKALTLFKIFLVTLIKFEGHYSKKRKEKL